jgi:sec-independent protein translocase protein TatC
MKVFPRIRRRSPEERSGTMTVVEHLEELRSRLIASLVAIGIGAAIGWFLYDPVIRALRDPYCDYWRTVPADLRPTQSCVLVFLGPLDGMIVKLKAVFFLGVIIAVPVLLWELWRFIVPGLSARERKMAIPFLFSSTLLFLLGVAFAYWTLPKGLSFLLGFAGEGFAPFLTGSQYLTFVMLVAFAFGVSFEFPILLIFLQLAGILSSKKLGAWRRYAILFIAVFAAIITPSSDPYTMLAMMIPMYIFYEAAIIIGRLLKR